MALKTRQTPNRQRMQSAAVSSDSRSAQCKISPTGQPAARFTELVPGHLLSWWFPQTQLFPPIIPYCTPPPSYAGNSFYTEQ